MQLTITGQHVELTDAIRAYAEEKLGRIDHYFDQVLDGHVVLKFLSHEKVNNVAEVSVHAPGNTFYAEARDQDMYAAIDALSDKLEGQVRRFKEKLTERKGPGTGRMAPATEME